MSLCSVVTNILDFDIVVNEFAIIFIFWLIPVGKIWNLVE